MDDYRSRRYPEMVCRAEPGPLGYYLVNIPSNKGIRVEVMRESAFLASFVSTDVAIPWPTDADLRAIAEREADLNRQYEELRARMAEHRRIRHEEWQREEDEADARRAAANTARAIAWEETKRARAEAETKKARRSLKAAKLVRTRRGQRTYPVVLLRGQFAPPPRPQPYPGDYFRPASLEWIGDLWSGYDYADFATLEDVAIVRTAEIIA